MATAIVTLKVTARELSAIREALRMHAYVSRRVMREDTRDSPFQGFKMDTGYADGDLRRAAMLDDAILKDIAA